MVSGGVLRPSCWDGHIDRIVIWFVAKVSSAVEIALLLITKSLVDRSESGVGSNIFGINLERLQELITSLF